MKIKSYAKLNLMLEILGKNSSNMHEISGIFQNINLYDEIEILESNFDSVNTFNLDITQEDNLAFKALKLMKKELSINNFFKVNIHKNIPISSGLGGGSSNAAAIIFALNRMMNLNLTITDMVSISKKLGSDIPFFFTGGTCYVTGVGENVEKLNRIFIDKINLNTINLDIRNKTKKMYGFIQQKNFSNGDKTDELKKLIMSSSKIFPSHLYNVFFDIAKLKFKEVSIQSLKMTELINNCSLSGAGMTLFSISEYNINFKKYKAVDMGLEVVI